MTDFQFHELTKENGVARIVLNRPKHNVFNIDMMRELTGLLADLDKDADLKCVVISGKGASWCAGVEVGDHSPELAPEMIRVFDLLLKQIESMAVPTIAAVHGACLGGGMEVAIACDMVVGATAAVFGQPEIKLGFFPPYAAVRLPHLVGPAKAIEICTTGRRYTAEAMFRMGLLADLLEPDAFEDGIAALVKEICQSSPLIIRLNKRAVNRHLEMSPAAAMKSVNDMFLNELMKTEDTQEGLNSFAEKRRAVWVNR